MGSNRVPTFELEHFTLSPFREADAPDVFEYASHPQVTRSVTWGSHRSLSESRDYVRDLIERTSFETGRMFVPWAVRERCGTAVIGSITITELGPNRSQLGFVFHFDYWHRNVEAEAVRSVIDWAFTEQLRFDRIQGRCFPNHVASHQIFEAAGMQAEGVNRAMLRVRGEARDIALYAITRSDWACLKTNGRYLSGVAAARDHI